MIKTYRTEEWKSFRCMEKRLQKRGSRCKGERRVPPLKGDSEADEKRRIMVM